MNTTKAINSAETKIKGTTDTGEIINKTNVDQTLEFDQVKAIWSGFALTQWAKDEIGRTEPFLSELELRAKLRETTEARTLLEKGGNPPLTALGNLAQYLLAAEKGDCLSAAQLEETGQALVAVMRLKNYLKRCQQFEIPLAYYEEDLDDLEALRELIQMQIRGGRIDDGASALLKSLRGDIERTKDRMQEKADAIMRANKECMSDSFSTSRNGHICIPVKKEYKFKVSGIVIDKSSTGATLFIEPSAVSKYYEQLQLLLIDAENEERRILYTLTVLVGEHAETMRRNQKVIEKLDYIFSKGKLSLELGGTEPEINTDRRIRLEEARHPLMDREVCVPLQFELGGEREGRTIRGIVITGPNTGGKTVAIKTVALNCMMAQCGLHVTCGQAQVCMNSNYLCDIGDGQNLSENLSTFSAHITNVLDILRKVNNDSLVIMDELGSGTDPTEGMGIAVAILEELKKSGALFLVTTHYPEVKQYAEQEEAIVNARMTFDRESLAPLYRMVIGEAGESCALYIARRLGMPDVMLANAAKAAYGEDASDMVWMPGPEHAQQGEQKKERPMSGEPVPKIRKQKKTDRKQENAAKFQLGDSVMVFPEKKIGIVCRKANEKGVLRVQMPDKKIWINHKRVKLHVPAEELYPDDYDFSIVFDTVQNRKLRHKMGKRHVEGAEIVTD